MAGELIAPPELAPPVPANLTPGQGIALGLEVMSACHELLLAGLRREIGPHGDLRAAYRQWYVEQMEEHDRTLIHMLQELDRRAP